MAMTHKTVRTPAGDRVFGKPSPEWPPVILLHVPDDIHSYDGAAPLLAERGCGFWYPGCALWPTRFLSPETPRSGEQAHGQRPAGLHDALAIDRRYSEDTTGRTGGLRGRGAVAGAGAALMSINGYNIQNIAACLQPAPPSRNMPTGTNGISTPSGRRPVANRTRSASCSAPWSQTGLFPTPSTTPPASLTIRFRRCGDPVVPAPASEAPGDPALAGSRHGSGATFHHGAGHCAPRGGGWGCRWGLRGACAALHAQL